MPDVIATELNENQLWIARTSMKITNFLQISLFFISTKETKISGVIRKKFSRNNRWRKLQTWFSPLEFTVFETLV